MGHTLCNCIFLGIIALHNSTCLWASYFLMLRSLRSFVIASIQQSCGHPLGRIPGTTLSFAFLGQMFVSILWRWPKSFSLPHYITLGTLIIPCFLWSSLIWTIPLLADVKWRIVLLDAGVVLQPYSKLFLIQELNMLPDFLVKTTIGNDWQ